MWFKNLTLFRLTSPLDLTVEDLSEQLSAKAFHPCPRFETQSRGFVAPLGQASPLFAHSSGTNLLFCLRLDDKILPAAVIKDRMQEICLEQEQRDLNDLNRREKRDLHDKIYQEMLPKAFCRSRRIFGYFNLKNNLLVIDTSSKTLAGEVTSHLRHCLQQLPIAPLNFEPPLTHTMTGWLGYGLKSEAFQLGESCELHDRQENHTQVRYKGQDLSSDEIASHLQAGKMATRIALSWREQVDFVLDQEGCLRQCRFTELVQEQLQDLNADGAQAERDAVFALMSGTLDRLLVELFELLTASSQNRD